MAQRHEPDGSVVLQILKLAQGPMTASEIARTMAMAMGLERKSTRRYVDRLLRDAVQWSFIKRDQDNRYSVSNKRLNEFTIDQLRWTLVEVPAQKGINVKAEKK